MKKEYNEIISPDFDEKDIKWQVKQMEKGNLPAMIFIIMNNQRVLNRKLNKILGIKNVGKKV